MSLGTDYVPVMLNLDGAWVSKASYDALLAERDALREAMRWVINDAAYKAPEQVTAGLAAMWLRRLNAALKASEEATGDSLARSGPGAKA